MYRRSRAYLVLSRSDRRDATGGGGDDLAAGTAHSVGPARAESGADARVHGSRSRHVFVGFQVVPGGVAGATVRSSRFQDGALSEDIFFFSFCEPTAEFCPARTGSRRRHFAVRSSVSSAFADLRFWRALADHRASKAKQPQCARRSLPSRMAPARGKRSAAGDAPSSPLTGGNDLGSSREVDVEIVVPCYNEAARLRVADFVAFARDPETRARLLFVNDGSTDGTLDVLRKARKECPERIDVLNLASNVGKAEAVRLGMRRALRCGDPTAVSEDTRTPPPPFVGFWDADLATPLDHVRLFRDVFADRPGTDMVFGARVGLLGRDIRRSARRHYVGRVFATLASLALRVPVYDTQCGAKLFRADGDLRAALSEPFDTRWVFDCELIGRYASLRRARDELPEDANAEGASAASFTKKKRTRRTTTTTESNTSPAPVLREETHAKKPRRAASVAESIYEYPLHRWEDVAGSKVRPSDVVKMAWGLVRLRMKYFAREPWTPTPTPKSGGRRAIGGL